MQTLNHFKSIDDIFDDRLTSSLCDEAPLLVLPGP